MLAAGIGGGTGELFDQIVEFDINRPPRFVFVLKLLLERPPFFAGARDFHQRFPRLIDFRPCLAAFVLDGAQSLLGLGLRFLAENRLRLRADRHPQPVELAQRQQRGNPVSTDVFHVGRQRANPEHRQPTQQQGDHRHGAETDR
ncbi:MAG: hypothetical protein V9H25_17065 [Candidatus Competibacter sp.]